MAKNNWIVLHQDLVTMECKRCSATRRMSIKIPAPMEEYIAVLQVATKSFTAEHQGCQPVEETEGVEDLRSQQTDLQCHTEADMTLHELRLERLGRVTEGLGGK